MGLRETTFASFVDVKSTYIVFDRFSGVKFALIKSQVLTMRRIRRLSLCSINVKPGHKFLPSLRYSDFGSVFISKANSL
jgi:hypothetical protein